MNKFTSKLLILLFAGLSLCVLAADYPGWWLSRGVVNTNSTATNDYAAVNAGQLKWIATNAYLELEANLPGGAGTDVANVVSLFTPSNNYGAINIGQLKYVATPFYDRLIAEGYATNYPWTTGIATDDVDYAVANIGQLKYVFSFDLPKNTDTDGDGMPDWIEQQIVDADPDDHIEKIEHVLPNDDYDQDGVSNADEIGAGSNPADDTSLPCLARFITGTQSRTELQGQATVEVGLSFEAVSEVQVRVSVIGGTAKNGGVDYTLADSQILIFAPSDISENFTLSITADTAREPDETIVLKLEVVSGPAVAGSPSVHVVTITDAAPDSDADGLPDVWEQQIIDADPNDGIVTLVDVVPDDDFDNDGVNNLLEWKRGMDPTTGFTTATAEELQLTIKTPFR